MEMISTNLSRREKFSTLAFLKNIPFLQILLSIILHSKIAVYA